jgi:secreted trypsin-like serine protease
MSRELICALAFLLTWGYAVASEAASKPLQAVRQAWAQRLAGDMRIVGGKPTTIAKNPWQIGLLAADIPENQFAQFCGGSIIAPRWVATAAHCVDGNTTASEIQVLSGTASLVSGGRRSAVAEIVVHEKWNFGTSDFDIALLRISDCDSLDGLVIVAADQEPQDAEVRVTGWGTTRFGGIRTRDLQEVSVPFVSRQRCNRKASYDGRITDNMLCAGKDEGGADSCQGDSGGPATIAASGSQRLLGIVSWGDGCGDPNKYGVYTSVPVFRGWVRDKTHALVSW